MKIAVMHDYFDEIGGAEITLLILARAFKATIITTNIDKNKISELGYKDVKFISIGKAPQIAYLKQIVAKFRFWQCDLRKYFDLFIFGGFCSIFAAKKHKNNIWYCFSPERGLYDFRYRYFSKYNVIVRLIVEVLIIFDKYFAKYIKTIIAPSENVKSRIFKYYNKQSTLNYSPVSTDEFYYKPHKNYWLCVSRLDPYKRLELQLKAFEKLPEEQLIIVGTFSKENEKYFLKLKNACPNNVKFVGGVFDKQRLVQYYAQCKGFIVTSINEDFGMAVVEAMASGKPVIAPKEGGYKETVIDGVTGKLIDNINAEKLVEAIKEIGKEPEKYKSACLKQAQKFNTEVFIKEIKEVIENKSAYEK